MPETLQKYIITFHIKYRRTDFDSDEPDPTSAELEKYVSESEVIPQNPFYCIEGIIGEVMYIGNLYFKFTCSSALSPRELTDSLLHQNMVDGEWESFPGFGSFVYPTKTENPIDAKELGCLFYDNATAYPFLNSNL